MLQARGSGLPEAEKPFASADKLQMCVLEDSQFEPSIEDASTAMHWRYSAIGWMHFSHVPVNRWQPRCLFPFLAKTISFLTSWHQQVGEDAHPAARAA